MIKTNDRKFLFINISFKLYINEISKFYNPIKSNILKENKKKRTKKLRKHQNKIDVLSFYF